MQRMRGRHPDADVGEAVLAPLIHTLRPLLGSGKHTGGVRQLGTGGGGAQRAGLEDGARQLRGLRRPLHAR
uniref:Uncharacterized protein n=1 Tax=Triticum urartu TaxID=4572 RepID=A0A8R7ULS8_TRIUA